MVTCSTYRPVQYEARTTPVYTPTCIVVILRTSPLKHFLLFEIKKGLLITVENQVCNSQTMWLWHQVEIKLCHSILLMTEIKRVTAFFLWWRSSGVTAFFLWRRPPPGGRPVITATAMERAILCSPHHQKQASGFFSLIEYKDERWEKRVEESMIFTHCSGESWQLSGARVTQLSMSYWASCRPTPQSHPLNNCIYVLHGL